MASASNAAATTSSVTSSVIVFSAFGLRLAVFGALQPWNP
jgi:hypothetical protein